jgi:hypothetical protein
LQCIYKNYDVLDAELTKYGLDKFDKDLFAELQRLLPLESSVPKESFTGMLIEALQRLIFVIRLGQEQQIQERQLNLTKQQYLGATIGRMIACGVAMQTQEQNVSVFKTRTALVKDQPKASYCRAVDEILGGENNNSSQRAYNVISVYDGIHLGYLGKWLAGDQIDVKQALRESAGQVHNDRCGRIISWRRCREEVNREIEKVGTAAGDLPKPWRPADYRHRVPTLILAGEADPVVAGGQAEEIFRAALNGPRFLWTFPKVGHLMDLPSFFSDRAIDNRGPCSGKISDVPKRIFSHAKVRECIIHLFLSDEGIEGEMPAIRGLEAALGSKIQIEPQEESPYEKTKIE